MERCPAAPKNTRAMSSRWEVDLKPRSRSRPSSRTCMPRRRATSFSSSHRASSRRLIAASRLNGPPAVCKGRPCTLARAGVRGGQGRPAMIKTILVALDGSEHADAALQYALWLAEPLPGPGLGPHVIDVVSIEGSFLHDISGSLGFEPYLDFSAKMRVAIRYHSRW